MEVRFSPNFYGRQINLNQAREICKMVERTYPYESLWKQGTLELNRVIKETPDYSERLKKLSALRKITEATSEKLDAVRDKFTRYTKDAFSYFRALSEAVHEFKTLNCGEAARLVYMIMRINEVDDTDTKVVTMKSFDKEGGMHNIDHVITKVKTENGEVGVDALIGETDYLENLETIYKEKYTEAFNLEDKESVEFFNIGITDGKMPRLNDKEAKALAMLYPEFILK